MSAERDDGTAPAGRAGATTASTAPAVRVLGQVALADAAADRALGRGQARELLALLAASRSAPVPTSTVVDALWEDDPPATATTIVHGHVRRIRQALGPEAVVHDVGGYRLDLSADAVDLWQLDDAVRAGDHRRARTMWADPPFGPYAARPWARAATAGLHHLRSITAPGAGRRPPRRPVPATRLVGRRQELRAVRTAITRSRLVTIVGLGGVGKSRLALEAVASTDETVHVDLGSPAAPSSAASPPPSA